MGRKKSDITPEERTSARRRMSGDITARVRGVIGDRRLRREDKPIFMDIARDYFLGMSIFRARDAGKLLGIQNSTGVSKLSLANEMVDLMWKLQELDGNVEPDVCEPSLHRLNDRVIAVTNDAFTLGRFVATNIDIEGIFIGDFHGGIVYDRGGAASVENAAVIPQIVECYNLRSGDWIEGRKQYIPDAGFYCLVHVLSVNGEPIEHYERVYRGDGVVTGDTLEPSERLCLGEGEICSLIDEVAPLYRGQSYIISTSGRFDFTKGVIEVGTALKGVKDIDEVIAVHYGDNSESIKRLRTQFPFGSLSEDGGAVAENGAAFSRTMTYAERQAKLGRHVAVVVGNIDSVGGMLGWCARGAIAKARDYGNGSVTVVAFADRDFITGQYYGVKNTVQGELHLKKTVKGERARADEAESFSIE